MTLREITRRPKKALARRCDIDDEPVVQVQRLDTRMGSGLFINATWLQVYILSRLYSSQSAEDGTFYIVRRDT